MNMIRETAPVDSLCDTPDKVAAYWSAAIATNPQFSFETQEVAAVILLSTRRRIIGHHITCCGTLDTLLIQPRDVFRVAIVTAAAAIVVCHNHPSGDPTPSEGDIRVTRDLIRAGEILKIAVADHVVMGQPSPERERSWVSLRELGFFS